MFRISWKVCKKQANYTPIPNRALREPEPFLAWNLLDYSIIKSLYIFYALIVRNKFEFIILLITCKSCKL